MEADFHKPSGLGSQHCSFVQQLGSLSAQLHDADILGHSPPVSLSKLSETFLHFSTNLRCSSFDITTNGILTSIPFALNLFVLLVSGWFTDLIINKGWIRTGRMRNINTAAGLLLSGVFVVLAGYMGCDASAAIAFFTLRYVSIILYNQWTLCAPQAAKSYWYLCLVVWLSSVQNIHNACNISYSYPM